MHKRGRSIKIFRRKFFVSLPKISVGELFCAMCQKISGSEKVMDKRGGGGEYQDLPSKISCLRVPKNFVEELFCVSKNLWYRKMLGIREGAGITIFRQNCFVSQYRKTS